MFYSEAILLHRGPLAKVWLAAHLERKLSKTQTLQTDIEQTACAIMGPEVEWTALLGVVRIYSRKAKYLLDDCNEALLKIKVVPYPGIRPGVVDMIEEQLAANRSAITLQGGNLDLDVLIPGINWWVTVIHIEWYRIAEPQGHHITLAMDSISCPSDGIGSQNFGELDLGLDFGDGPVSVINGIVEVGHDAPIPGVRERTVDMPFGPDTGGMDVDLGLDFRDGPLSEPERMRTLITILDVFLASPLTEPLQTPLLDMQYTLRLAAETTGEDAEGDGTKVKWKPKEKKQIIDTGEGGVLVPLSFKMSHGNWEDPLAHFLPTKVTPEGTYLCVGPPGLAPELTGLFLWPIQSGPLSKKRDASVVPSVGLPGDVLGPCASLAPDGGGFEFGNMTRVVDDFQMNVPDDFPMAQEDLGAERAKSLALSELTHLSTPGIEGEEETHADPTCPIAAFDIRPLPSSQSQEMGGDFDRKGYRKNTIKALAIICRDLQPMHDGQQPAMSFTRMSQKASQWAASMFFFELRVLGMRNCIKLTQSAAFKNIKIQAKPKLWEKGSSIASAMSL
ncbi:Rec8 like protein-domain-containing protein [Pisolithus croceorrhizus]|nr:Rec8 like protein-domain-containing protein [Pisolithus croceorrhizus]